MAERLMFGNGVAIPKEATPRENDWKYVGFIGDKRLENNYIYIGSDPEILSIPEDKFGIPERLHEIPKLQINFRNRLLSSKVTV